MPKTNKYFSKITSNLFNEAFILMNSRQVLKKDENYLFKFENIQNYRKLNKFYFKADIVDYNEAINILDTILILNPTHKFSFELRAIAKVHVMNLNEAIEDYTKAIEFDPNYSNAYNGRGVGKLYLKEYNAAIDDFTKAIEIDPYYSIAYNNLGNAKMKLMEFRAAVYSGETEPPFRCKLSHLSKDEFDMQI